VIARTLPTWRRLSSFTVAMLAACSLAHAENASRTPAERALDEYASQPAAQRQGAEAAAEYYYDRGMKAMEAARLDDAIQALTIAVDWQPDKPKYRKALEQAQALAGTSRDARSVHINRTADEMYAKQQQLWVEALKRIEDGKKEFEAGDFVEAERNFNFALTRLESLPFNDDRKAPTQREVEKLIAVAKERREQKEIKEAAARNLQALERQRELRDIGLKIERDRIDAMLKRAQKARERRDFDEAILLCEQVLKINRAEGKAHSLLITCRRERHVYLRQMTADRWDEEHKLLSEKIRSEMLPMHELVNYSPEWPEIDARRSAPTQGLEEENEAWRKEINNQLEQEVTLDFQDHDLVDVLAFLQRITNVNIVLDPKVIAKGSPPVTLRVEAMKLRYVLEFIMRLTGLSYIMRNEAIFISDTQGLRGDLFMKLYDIRDLTHAMTSFPGPDLAIPEPGGTGSRLLPPIESENKPETSEFIDIIQKVVSPEQWKGEGVAISEYGGGMVITQNSDVHKEVANLLRTLRNQKSAQIHIKVKFLNVENSLLEEIGVDWKEFGNPLAPAAAPAGFPAMPRPSQVAAQTFGAYKQQGDVIAAANDNNILQGYTNTGHSLPAATGGLTFKTENWRMANNLFVAAVLHAVEQERRGNIIYEPDIMLFNGQQAHIVNIYQQAYISDYDVNQGQYDPVISVLAYGTVLDVQGIASADKKYITLTLRPSNANVVRWRRFGGAVASGANTFGGGAPIDQAGAAIATGNPLFIPELRYEAVRTSVTIPDGGSLLLAGMTNGESARSHAGIPFLSHIPFLGRLFSTNGRQETEMKSLILVQADIILFEEIEKKL
jgi:general secretion pathway protein D